jgi:hypothetical protein
VRGVGVLSLVSGGDPKERGEEWVRGIGRWEFK